MLQSNDLILLLTTMASQGVEEANEYIRRSIGRPVSMDTLKFVNSYRQLDVTKFYERLRKNHNEKKSNLYKNIVRDNLDTDEIISTLHALSLQIYLFSRYVDEENKSLFFKHARAEEITRVLNKFYTDFDLTSAMKILRLVKADLLAFEYVNGRRDEQGNILSK